MELQSHPSLPFRLAASTQVVQTYFGILDQITLMTPAVYYDSLYVNIATGCPEIPPVRHWEAVSCMPAKCPFVSDQELPLFSCNCCSHGLYLGGEEGEGADFAAEYRTSRNCTIQVAKAVAQVADAPPSRPCPAIFEEDETQKDAREVPHKQKVGRQG
eukprot:233677-Pelagomonas_calceolata.AAC.3